MIFSELNLAEPVLRAVTVEKYTTPSPIQEQTIPHLLAGKDVLGCAQTGTGKTAAFALPIIHRLYEQGVPRGRRAPRALILAPTRELAAQVGASFNSLGKFTGIKTAIIFGGVGQGPQAAALRNGVDVVVTTPGRLIDLMNQRLVDLRQINTLVLDEADHMLDMGFIHDVKRIISKIPGERHTMLFSATMPKEIASLAAAVLKNPVNIAVAAVSSPVETVTQSVYHVDKAKKGILLVDLLKNGGIKTGLVFSRTKHGADKICRMLNAAGIQSDAIHGNKSQSARKQALDSFKRGKLRVLVATDIAARGIDIHALPHVVNYDLPDVPETYVHRIGRTGRAGRQGTAVSFCDVSERSLLRDIERLISISIPIESDHPLAGTAPSESRGSSGSSFAPRRRSGDNRSSAHRSSGHDRRNGGGRPQRRGKTQDRYKKSA
ncbi:MAG: DEAD/DEAH box helicase [Planctomycetaceae bacterium]|nr:DEAD/DEAH box helicase [Planctomycetaceae bacterium]